MKNKKLFTVLLSSVLAVALISILYAATGEIRLKKEIKRLVEKDYSNMAH